MKSNDLGISRELLEAWVLDLQTSTANVALMQMQELLANHIEEPRGVVETKTVVTITDEKGRAKCVSGDWCEKCDIVKPHETRRADCWPDPAPAVVVLPDREEEDNPQWREGRDGAYINHDFDEVRGCAEGWNACLDKVKEMNR